MGRGESSYRRDRSRSPRKRSYSPSPKRSRSYRSRSRDGGSRIPRGRFYDGRERPDPNPCLGVFGMSLHTSERDLKRIFGQYGEIETVQIVYDRYSGRSRGFGFVYFVKTRDATRAKDHLRDAVIDGMRVRVDYSVTKSGGSFRHNRFSRSPTRSPVRRSSRKRSRSPTPPVRASGRKRTPTVSRSRSRTFSNSRSRSLSPPRKRAVVRPRSKSPSVSERRSNSCDRSPSASRSRSASSSHS